nr:tetratricopeptide repeat protein [Acidobacteriota bacterium]NIM62356.1 tetratricopeptide repeat protein [Acidobacteriota bacterium]NIO58259.1 tetratricopeptide repeat protein [Acidobacteriota bacterium]NIQ29288.1 tetratricopeptide repeat protein [Acidobacteriota bacterium]NIQ86731.1 tetratricopeptide repeat protein [Acidobacteriota bacterium]
MGERSSRRTIPIVLALLAATFVAYLPALSGGFIWDDNDWVTENPAVTGEQGWAAIWTGEARLQYYPLLFSAFRVQHVLWGSNPVGYHTVNVLLHALTAILLGLLLVRIDLRFPWWIAFAFALHPVHVESVAWITELKNVLSGALGMGSMLAFAHAVRTKRIYPTLYVVALALFTAAVLSKTAVATALFVLPALVYLRRGRFRPADAMPLIPFAAVGVALGWIAVSLERGMAAVVGTDFGFSWTERLLIASRAVFFYPYKLVVPYPLVFNYHRWELTGWQAWAWPPLALAGLIVCFVAWRRGYRTTVLALAVYGVLVAPALGLFDVYWFRYAFVADHFAYLASIGILALASELLGRHLPGTARQRAAIGVGLLATLGVLTWNQTHAYRNTTSLWTHTIEHNPDSWLAHHSLALEALDDDRPDIASRHFDEALRCKPGAAESLTGRAMLRIRETGYADALADLDRAIELVPNYPQARLQRGIARARLGRWQAAIDDLEPFLAANPGTVTALAARAEAYVRLGRF